MLGPVIVTFIFYSDCCLKQPGSGLVAGEYSAIPATRRAQA
jgi:hypothetical protein